MILIDSFLFIIKNKNRCEKIPFSTSVHFLFVVFHSLINSIHTHFLFQSSLKVSIQPIANALRIIFQPFDIVINGCQRLNTCRGASSCVRIAGKEIFHFAQLNRRAKSCGDRRNHTTQVPFVQTETIGQFLPVLTNIVPYNAFANTIGSDILKARKVILATNICIIPCQVNESAQCQ